MSSVIISSVSIGIVLLYTVLKIKIVVSGHVHCAV